MSITKTATFSAAFIAVFLLTACEAAPPAQEEMQPQQQEQPTNEQEGEVLQPTTEGETEELMTVPPLVSQEDWTLYTGAIQLLDESYCQQIADENLRNQCATEISDEKIMKSAVEAGDYAMCDQLETSKVQICRMRVDLAKQTEENFRDPTEEERQIMNEAFEARDASICDRIESERKRANCVTNVEMADQFAPSN